MTEVRDVVRAVVAEHAPHEVPLVDGLRQFDDERAVRILTGRGRRREPLGFGLAEATALITPVVWVVLDQVARRGVDAAADGLVEKGRAALRRVLRRGPVEPPRTLVELDREQLALVRTRILERAIERGLGHREAEALADGVVTRLVTGDGVGEADATPRTPRTPE